MSYAAPIEIVQAALALLGGEVITSLEDGSVPSTIIKTNYESIVSRRLAAHTYTFASYPVILVYQGERDAGALRHAYMLPNESIKVHWVGKQDARLAEWAINNGKILTRIKDDYEALISYRALESDWSPEFTDAMIQEVYALFVGSIRRDYEAARLIRRDAELLFRSALASDKRQHSSPPAMSAGKLVEAYSGGRISRTYGG